MDCTDATVNIPSTGEHKLSLVMREDGLIVDKVVLTTNASFAPTGNGPSESPFEGSACSPDPCSDSFQQDVGINDIVSREVEHFVLRSGGIVGCKSHRPRV